MLAAALTLSLHSTLSEYSHVLSCHTLLWTLRGGCERPRMWHWMPCTILLSPMGSHTLCSVHHASGSLFQKSWSSALHYPYFIHWGILLPKAKSQQHLFPGHPSWPPILPTVIPMQVKEKHNQHKTHINLVSVWALPPSKLLYLQSLSGSSLRLYPINQAYMAQYSADS